MAETPQASSPATRRSMQGNRSKDTRPEMAVRRGLRQRGLTGYRLQWGKVPGRPDVAFPGRRVAIFVNGCFWHRCPYCHPSAPQTHAEFWDEKFARNRRRDRENQERLTRDGWTVVVVWECRLKRRLARRTLSDIACEVRLGGTRLAGVAGTGRLVVAGRGMACRERACRQLRGLARAHRAGLCGHAGPAGLAAVRARSARRSSR